MSKSRNLAKFTSDNEPLADGVLDKSDIGLSDVDNVSASDLRDRSTHTGTQTLSTISDAGTIASQDADSVDIDGGNIDGTPIGANSADEGNFTTLDASGDVNFDSGTLFVDASADAVGIGTTSPAKTLDVSGEIRASTGILFGSDTAAANTLDDYEEGAWTPIIQGSSPEGTAVYTRQFGFYVKIGRQVWANCDVRYNSGTGGGNLFISGLPFVSSASFTQAGGHSITDSISLAANTVPYVSMSNSVSRVALTQQQVSGNTIAASYDNAGIISFSITYFV